MRNVQRLIGAFVAAVFLATASFHIFAHTDTAESSCVVCHVQQASLPAASAPAVAAAFIQSVAVENAYTPTATARVHFTGAARAPPAFAAA